MKRNRESGSLTAIIIAILFVSLMATLGIVFYQNFVAKDDSDTPQTTQPASTAPTDTATRVAFNSDIYGVDHPKDWNVATTKLKDSTMGGSTTTITNADGTIQAQFTITEKSTNISCSDNDDLKISFYDIGPATSDKLAGVPLYVVEAFFDHTGGGYQYKIGLTPDSGDTHAAVGQTHCNIAHVGVVSTALLKKKQLVRPTITATINFPKLPAMPEAASKDMQTIKDIMATDDYKAAVKILESARKE